MKKKIVTVKAIQKFLSDCRFNPNEHGPLKIILESGNPDYYETRAIELIYEAKSVVSKSNTQLFLLEEYEDKIRKAIQLLTLSILMRKSNEK